MKLPNFEVIKTDDNRFKLVSNAGHSHYKEAIEMLLQSEMFIKHNLYLINFYRQGLSMIENDVVGLVELPSFEVFPYEDRFSPEKYLQCANGALSELMGFSHIVEAHGQSLDKEIDRLVAVIELVKKVFPEIQTNKTHESNP